MQVSTALADLTWSMLTKFHNDPTKPGSIVFSPLSISVALGILVGAADGEVRTNLRSKLGIQKEEDLPLLPKTLGVSDNEPHSSSALSSANAVFTDSSVDLYAAYKSFLAAFQAESFQYPSLADNVDKMNMWISNQTQGMIRDMFSEAQLATAHIVLVNAIAFKGAWETPFNPINTRNVPFHITPETEKTVSMMFMNKKTIPTYEHAKFYAIRLQYVSKSSADMSMIAYLPKDGVSIGSMIELLGVEKSACPSSNFRDIKYDQFGFPKFEIQTDFSLMGLLAGLGYPINGPFPRMGTGINVVQEILHKAIIKVDEEGTTAAAATAVVMTRSRPMNPKILIFNRPFVYTIVSHDSEALLFAGIYSG